MMNRSVTTLFALTMTAALAGAGCGEDLGEPDRLEADGEVSQQAVVMPELTVGDEESEVSDLIEHSDFEIRLEPAGDDRGDQSRAQSVGSDEFAELPAGVYDLEVYLELDRGEEFADEAAHTSQASALMVDDEESQEGDDQDGNPLPLPADLLIDDHSEEDDEDWMVLASTDGTAVGWGFDQISLEAGDQLVEVHIDAAKWAEEFLDEDPNGCSGSETDGGYEKVEEFLEIELQEFEELTDVVSVDVDSQ